MSILRTSKFIKHFVSINRHISANRFRKTDVSLFKKASFTPSLQSSLQFRYLRQVTSAKAVNIEKSIQKLDQEVRKSGRITRKDLDETLAELIQSNNVTSTQSLMLIRCCGNLLPEESSEVRTNLSHKIWKTLEKMGVPLDISHYNALLRIYIENEHKFSPSEFLAELKNKNIEPNRVTYQRLIAAYCHQGDIEGATKILEFMKERQMPVNESVFSSLINGHFQSGDIQSAIQILNVMKQANIKPSADTYTVLMCGYAKNGDLKAINEVLAQCEKEDVDISDRDILNVIYSAAVNNNSDIINQLFDKLKKTPGYNQDARNYILRLISLGKDDTAIKLLYSLLPVTVDGEQVPTGNFLIKQMVKFNRPVENILSICSELKNSGLNEFSLLVATEASLLNKNPNLSLQLLTALSKEHEMCQHYYWPVLVQYGKAEDYEGLKKTLTQMITEVGQPVSGETLRDYAVPFLPEGEPGILELKKVGIPVPTSAAAVIGHLLLKSNIKLAAKLALQYRANYTSPLFCKSVAYAYSKTNDLEAFITLVRIIVDCSKDVTDKTDDSAERILLDVLKIMLQENKFNKISQLLQAYLEYGISISPQAAESLQDLLGEKHLTQEISNMLSQLSSPDLELSELERKPQLTRRRALLNIFNDESSILKSIEDALAKGDPALGLKRQLLSYYCIKRELIKAEEYYQELKRSNFEFVTGSLVHLMDLYIHYEKLPEALEFYHKIFANRTEKNNVQIDPSKILRLGGLMIKQDKLEDAFELFSKHSSDYDESHKGFNSNSAGWSILNYLAEKKDPELVRKVFDKLIECELIEANNITLGPLIKVHLLRNDVDSALAAFEECCQKYRATPWKNEIACSLIQKEDPISLQKLTDLSTEIHGEINSLYDLVLSFIECGRIRQARKILETPGLRLRNQRINSACEKYNQEGKVNHLENLIEATKDFNHIDRSDIYYHLLLSYCKTDDVDKAYGLWTQMQDEDVQPTDAFLSQLGSLLKKHGRPIPFSIPEVQISESSPDVNKNFNGTSSQIKKFRKIMNSKNIDEALENLPGLNEKELSNGDRAKLLNLLLNNGRLREACNILIDWLNKGLKPTSRSVSILVNSLAQIGDVDTLAAVGKALDKDLLRYSSFSNRYTHCMVEAGRVNELLTQLEEEVKSAKTEKDIETLRETFPRGGIFSVLSSAPDSLEKVEEIVKLYTEKGILEPANALWSFYFSNGNTKKAEEYWTIIKECKKIMFQPIFKQIRLNNQIELCRDLLNLLKASKVDSMQLGPVYSLLINIENQSGNLSEAERILDEAIKECSIEYLGRNVLLRLKKNLEDNGRHFKYTLPPSKGNRMHQRQDFSSSSDSDSDSESVQKPRARL